MRMLRRWRLLSAVAVLAIVAAACGGDSEETTTTAAGGETTTTTAAGGETTTTTTAAPGGEAAMTITYTIAPEAVWSDGTPITWADFECTWRAALNTPGSIRTAGYDQITSVVAGADDKEVIVSLSSVYAPYKDLFGSLTSVIPAHTVANCDDISGDFATSMPVSGREWLQESWSPDQQILVPNPSYWNPERTPVAARVVMVPKADSDTEINSLKSGESGFIFPQAYAGITDALDDPNIEYTPGYGTNYEVWAMQQDPGCGVVDDANCVAPFADPIFRKAFMMSVDRELILANIYDPIFPGAPLLECGYWVPTVGDWCDNTIWADSYDPEGAAQLLTDNGWALNGDGFWAKEGEEAPVIRWIINTGNTRRETTQALMIPVLAEAGFDVIADNCDAACYFQQRLPGLDYDLAMFINTASPDPTQTATFACVQVPGPDNNFTGFNVFGYCNPDADALMYASDAELDEAARVEQIHELARTLYEDAVLIPLFQFPNIGAWRTDQIGGPVDAEVANFRGFGNNLYQWEPLNGDTIIIGAEQWPECLNPVTDCSGSSWMGWTTQFLYLPQVYDTTGDGSYVLTALMASEPVITTG